MWRYMGIDKLLDLLHTRTLFLSQVSKLGDSHEGTLPRRTQEKLEQHERERIQGQAEVASVEGFQTLVRHSMFVSSWCLSDTERYELWKIYGQEKSSVAIRMRYSQLVQCLGDSCNIGLVNYIDFEADEFDTRNYFNPIMHKRLQYRYEREVRIVQQAIRHGDGVLVFPSTPLLPGNPGLARYPDGLLTPFDLALNIDSLWVTPEASPWLLDALRASLPSLGLPAEKIHSSGLSSRPRLAPHRVTTEELELVRRFQKQ